MKKEHTVLKYKSVCRQRRIIITGGGVEGRDCRSLVSVFVFIACHDSVDFRKSCRGEDNLGNDDIVCETLTVKRKESVREEVSLSNTVEYLRDSFCNVIRSCHVGRSALDRTIRKSDFNGNLFQYIFPFLIVIIKRVEDLLSLAFNKRINNP